MLRPRRGTGRAAQGFRRHHRRPHFLRRLCPVKPGDLVLGDDDGVCVVPLERAEAILAASLDKIAQEEKTNANTASGGLPVDTMGLAEPEILGG